MKVLGKKVLLTISESLIEVEENKIITKKEDIQPGVKIDLIVAFVGDEVDENKVKVGDKVYIGTAQYFPALQQIDGEFYLVTKQDDIIAIL